MAVFYLPTRKLNPGICDSIHTFLVDNYKAYTKQGGDIKGTWVGERGRVHDVNVRYEVSFEGKNRIPVLVSYLSFLCRELDEEAIYLTMGDRSFLVNPGPIITPCSGAEMPIMRRRNGR